MLDVVEAIDGPGSTFLCTEIRQRGPLATPVDQCTKLCSVHRARLRADHAWRASLRATSIADLVADVERDSGPQALPRVGEWLAGQAT
ncbi:DNA-binding IscR family transcriptional regulator [Hamadaea flava]|nr:DNA-binding IscR family transcriptional regulator [Hamadaea flava]